MEIKSIEKKRSLENAIKYIGKIGSPQPHYRNGSVGGLVYSNVETKIAHQASHGDNNYHTNKEFDEALSKIIFSKFAELSREAIELMEKNYEETRISEKECLMQQLKEIEALERKQNGISK